MGRCALDYLEMTPSLRGMRVLANHFSILPLRFESNDLDRLEAYAVELGEQRGDCTDCGKTMVNHIRASRLRWQHNHDAGIAMLETSRPRCLIAEGDRLFRLSAARLAKAFATGGVYDEALSLAQDARATFLEVALNMPRLVRFDYVVKTYEAIACQPLGQALYLSGRIEEAVDVFTLAYDLFGHDEHITRPKSGKFMHRWWGNSADCCPALPTYERKVAEKGGALLNMCMAFSASDKSEQLDKAIEMMPQVNKDFPRAADDLNSFRAAWLDGRLKVVEHGRLRAAFSGLSTNAERLENRRKRRSLQGKTKTRLRHAFLGFLQNPDGSATDAMAVLSDLVALPWLAGKTAEEITRWLDIEDCTVKPYLAAAIDALPAKARESFDAMEDAARSTPDLVVMRLDAFRDALADQTWPPMAAWRRVHFAA